MKKFNAYLYGFFNQVLLGIRKFKPLLVGYLIFTTPACQNSSIEPIENKIPPIQELLINSEDEEETKYDLTLLKIAEALNPLLNDYRSRVLLDDENIISEDGELKVSDVFANQSLIESFADRKSMNTLEKTTNIITEVRAIETNLKYHDFSFETVLYIPNYKSANFELSPIIAIGSEIEAEDNDVIVGWYYEESGVKVYITISEDYAITAKRPVFIVNGSATNYSDNQLLVSNDEMINSRVSSNPTFTIDRYSISQRYGRSRRSEYSYVLLYKFANGSWGHPEKREEIREIKKKEINKTFYDDKSIWQVKYVADVDRLYVATFEHDWWTPKKYVDWGGGIGITVARMKFPWEWYQKFWIDVPRTGTKTFYSKGHIVVK